MLYYDRNEVSEDVDIKLATPTNFKFVITITFLISMLLFKACVCDGYHDLLQKYISFK